MTYERESPPDRRLHWVLLANASRARLAARLTLHVDRDLTTCMGQELERRVAELLPARPGAPTP